MKAMPQVIYKKHRPSPYSYSAGRREPSGDVPIVSLILGKIVKHISRWWANETTETITENTACGKRVTQRHTRSLTHETITYYEK